MILVTLNFVIPRNSTTIEMTKESSIVRHPLKNNFTTQQWYALQDELFNTHLSFNFLLVNKRENVVVCCCCGKEVHCFVTQHGFHYLSHFRFFDLTSDDFSIWNEIFLIIFLFHLGEVILRQYFMIERQLTDFNKFLVILLRDFT